MINTSSLSPSIIEQENYDHNIHVITKISLLKGDGTECFSGILHEKYAFYIDTRVLNKKTAMRLKEPGCAQNK